MHGRSRVVRWLHIVWAVPGLAASVLFVSATGGHPPGIVLLPLVLLVWAAGHAAIWGAGRLAHRASLSRGRGAPWPVSVVAATIGSGLLGFAGLFLVVATAIAGQGPSGRLQLPMLAAAGIAHAAVFIGLLSRQDWGRVAGALVAFGWFVILAVQVVDHVASGRRIDFVELGAALAVSTALGWMSYSLAFGQGPRAYTSPPTRHGERTGHEGQDSAIESRTDP